jgi:dTDP-glucose 4,6-dehydratase
MTTPNNILITGGAGFIGSNFIFYFLKTHPTYNLITLDKLTYAGSLNNLKEVSKNKKHTFVLGDICDEGFVKDLFESYNITSVIHFAAESHVDNSIQAPNSFIKTNIEGTFILLEAAKNYWKRLDDSVGKFRFYHISTDEVYGSLGREGYFTEKSPYAPNSPYSASKASSDFLVRSYYKTYGLNVVTSQCSNNYGPHQHDEKLIPTVIRKALAGEAIPIYGDGKNVRDWIYVLDHCKAIDKVFHHGNSGEAYIIGSHNELSNIQIAQKICSILDELEPKTKGKYEEQITFVQDRLGHDKRYAVDSSKIIKELVWKPKQDFEEGLKKTIKWYLKKYQKV